jgi:TPR repeat protein
MTKKRRDSTSPLTDDEQDQERPATPILEVNYDERYGELKLPIIWVTIPVRDLGTGQVAGRTYVNVYTPGQSDGLAFEPSADDGGWVALQYGSEYYREGFEYADNADREKRIDCFKAAEIFYLHSMQLGNIQALVNLGYLYEYDRCENQYWGYLLADMNDDCSEECYETIKEENCVYVFPREQRAFEYFERAYQAGNSEAAFKLGDSYAKGIGCEQDAARAFALYKEAYDSGRHEDASVWGSAAYRIARCYEAAKGCELDFEKALEFYKVAEVGLDEAIRNGNHYYSKNLSDTRKAIKRIKQELHGAY